MSDQDAIPERIVERHWPYDGPHSSDSVVSAAAAVIALLVRYICNATWTVRPQGPALYRALVSLNGAIYGMDQLLDQMATAALDLAPEVVERAAISAYLAGRRGAYESTAWSDLPEVHREFWRVQVRTIAREITAAQRAADGSVA
jgi:hypothetical protein